MRLSAKMRKSAGEGRRDGALSTSAPATQTSSSSSKQRHIAIYLHRGRAHTHTHAHTHTRMCTYTHTHTHTHARTYTRTRHQPCTCLRAHTAHAHPPSRSVRRGSPERAGRLPPSSLRPPRPSTADWRLTHSLSSTSRTTAHTHTGALSLTQCMINSSGHTHPHPHERARRQAGSRPPSRSVTRRREPDSAPPSAASRHPSGHPSRCVAGVFPEWVSLALGQLDLSRTSGNCPPDIHTYAYASIQTPTRLLSLDDAASWRGGSSGGARRHPLTALRGAEGPGAA
eukprot:GHVU01174160.1.p1 GENE.GHVU01174160.1~~GHVU01174160.1.p1  ORF type:complete len:284 (-),score=13.27 GHVU01174160.1:58-909(-)